MQNLYKICYYTLLGVLGMELRHLRYFIAVADELSFSRAAKRLQIAQPPLSQQIQALEAQLKVQLFNRDKRPIQLTKAGQAFLEEARPTLANLEQAIRKTQRIYQGELNYLTVGFTSSMANDVLPNILRTFWQRYPEIDLILREASSGSQIQELRDRQTDIIFVYQTPALTEAKDLEVTLLSEETLVAVLPQHHPLTAKSTISLIDLEHEEFVMPLRPVVSGLSEQIYALCDQAGFVPKVAQEAIFMMTILGLVAGEMGISILPSSAQNLRREGVTYRPIQEEAIANPLMIAWQQENSSPILKKFINIAKECIKPET
jgi:DNA-binding transcriptional LysR family regulator